MFWVTTMESRIHWEKNKVLKEIIDNYCPAKLLFYNEEKIKEYSVKNKRESLL